MRISITVGLLSTMLEEDSSTAVYQAKSWRMFVMCAVNTCSVAEIKIYLAIVRRWIRLVRFLLLLGWVKQILSY